MTRMSTDKGEMTGRVKSAVRRSGDGKSAEAARSGRLDAATAKLRRGIAVLYAGILTEYSSNASSSMYASSCALDAVSLSGQSCESLTQPARAAFVSGTSCIPASVKEVNGHQKVRTGGKFDTDSCGEGEEDIPRGRPAKCQSTT